MKKKLGSLVLAILILGSTLVEPRAALADDTIKHPGDHPQYTIEGEPHGVFGPTAFYANALGIGLGGRLSVIAADRGFIKTINNTVGVTFGLDYVYYGGCYYNTFGCGAGYLFFPVALQWNFYVAQKWSVFGEPGLFVYHGFFDTAYCAPGFLGCQYPNQTGVGPAFYLGGRYHFNEHVALTMRLGYPTFSVGVSFM